MKRVAGGLSFFSKWLIGPFGAVVVSTIDIAGLSSQQIFLTAIMIWVAAWWISQPIPLGMTGILGVCLTIIFGVAEPAVAFSGFSHKVVFLLLGTFLLAQAMHVHDVNRLLCSKLVSQRALASRPRLALAAFIGLVGILSWWVLCDRRDRDVDSDWFNDLYGPGPRSSFGYCICLSFGRRYLPARL